MELNKEQIKTLIEGDTLEINGFSVYMRKEDDRFSSEPWKECDGHGIISELVSRPKRAGERVLYRDHGIYRYYDFAGTIERAIEEGWGLPAEESKGLTKKQCIAAAVEKDFHRLKDWYDDKWTYQIITVVVLFNDTKVGSHAVGGIESDYVDDCHDIIQDCFSEAMTEAKAKVVEAAAAWSKKAEELKAESQA